jgi:hypothetical protein
MSEAWRDLKHPFLKPQCQLRQPLLTSQITDCGHPEADTYMATMREWSSISKSDEMVVYKQNTAE